MWFFFVYSSFSRFSSAENSPQENRRCGDCFSMHSRSPSTRFLWRSRSLLRFTLIHVYIIILFNLLSGYNSRRLSDRRDIFAAKTRIYCRDLIFIHTALYSSSFDSISGTISHVYVRRVCSCRVHSVFFFSRSVSRLRLYFLNADSRVVVANHRTMSCNER